MGSMDIEEDAVRGLCLTIYGSIHHMDLNLVLKIEG